MSGESLLGEQYWDINSCRFLMMVSAVLENVLYIRGYLLNLSTSRMYCLPLKIKKFVARFCQGLSGTSVGSIG